MNNWKKVFREFYNDNEAGGSSRWQVAPNIVETFIEGLIKQVAEEVIGSELPSKEAVARAKKVEFTLGRLVAIHDIMNFHARSGLREKQRARLKKMLKGGELNGI